MENHFKTSMVGMLLGAALTAGGSLLVDQSQLQAANIELQQTQVSKQEVLKQYVYAQVRLGEIPTLDLTFVTPEEYTQAYADLVNEKNTPKNDPDLFKDLKTQAIQEGIACKL